MAQEQDFEHTEVAERASEVQAALAEGLFALLARSALIVGTALIVGMGRVSVFLYHWATVMEKLASAKVERVANPSPDKENFNVEIQPRRIRMSSASSLRMGRQTLPN